ncbi:hypothetical protein [Prosthecomicrobium sp. N25]|uniref:hypothetical protein n=1 Tax=Prosthecomicrobium sp. N25 TaxID=3129254 RepID=UPI003076E606
MSQFGAGHRVSRAGRSGGVALALASILVTAQAAQAQSNDLTPLRPGEAFLTRFSGTAPGPDGKAVIDVNGVVGSVLDLRNPGFRAQGQHWLDEPQRLPVTAADVGQVYGVALDDQNPPNIYLTATSAFGLHRTADGRGWMAGQWGPAGGPGTVWKLEAARNYAPRSFANITLDGRENSGASLGNLAFDKAHRQFFVSDLETGMIHRLGMDGRDLGRYDHGVDGRSAHYDVPAARNASLPPVVFDPLGTARINDCGEGPFAETPSCWNVADPRRRVWGIGVRTDKASRETRLYYALWSGVALGRAVAADMAEGEKTGTVWSIRIAPSGDFDRTSIRREFEIPEFFVAKADFERAGPSHPVADISFPDCYDQPLMVLSERGGLKNLGLDVEEPFATSRESRVLRYEQDMNGDWKPTGRYDIGHAERKPPREQPWIRANASGAAAFGLGYTSAGTADPARPDQTLWIAGDHLCSPEGPCYNPATGTFEDDSQVHGLQGTPESAYAPLAPSGAFRVYPARGTVSTADGPQQSYMVDADVNVDGSGAPNPADLARNDATMIGDVAIWQPCEGQAAGTESPVEIGTAPLPTGPVDLWIRKSAVEDCDIDGFCSFAITITAIGEGAWRAPIFIRDMIPDGAELVSFTPADPWLCEVIDALLCWRPAVVLLPGEDLVLRIRIRLPEVILMRAPIELDNCVLIEWPFVDPDDAPAIEITVRNILVLMGYLPARGPGDLVSAILRFERDMRLEGTGRIGPRLVDALFGSLARMNGDDDPLNDIACAPIRVGLPPILVGGHGRASTHRRFGSFEHTRAMTHRRWASPAHNPWQSHFRWGSAVLPPVDLHSRAQTHARWGSVWHSRARTHRRDGSFPPNHDRRLSHDRYDSVHSTAMSHYRTSSIHAVDRSHYRYSSIHGRHESHDRFGSIHTRAETHRRDGSIHHRALSHARVESSHNRDRSHNKAGSEHRRKDSLLGGGFASPYHTRAMSHFRGASAGHDTFGDPAHRRSDSLGPIIKDKDKTVVKPEEHHPETPPPAIPSVIAAPPPAGAPVGEDRHNRLLSQDQRGTTGEGIVKGHTVAQSRGSTSRHTTAESRGPTPVAVHGRAASRADVRPVHRTAASRAASHSREESRGPVVIHSKAVSRAQTVGPVHARKASRGIITVTPDHVAPPVSVFGGGGHGKKASRGGHGGGAIGGHGPNTIFGDGGHAKRASRGGGFGGDHHGGGLGGFGGGGHEKWHRKGSFF